MNPVEWLVFAATYDFWMQIREGRGPRYWDADLQAAYDLLTMVLGEEGRSSYRSGYKGGRREWSLIGGSGAHHYDIVSAYPARSVGEP